MEVLLLVGSLLNAIFCWRYAQSLGETILEGDMYIQYVASLYKGPTNGVNEGLCQSIEPEAVQRMQAVRWALSKLNDIGYFPNRTIGIRVSETCHSLERIKNIALQLAMEMNNNNTDVVGCISPDSSSETEVMSRLLSSLPEEYRLLQLGVSSTAAVLSNKDIYRNFFRIIPTDDTQAKVIIRFMQEMNWTYAAVIYADDTYGRGGKDALVEKVNADVCFPVVMPIDPKNASVSEIGNQISDKIMKSKIPISGVVVFGDSVIADAVLQACEIELAKDPNATRLVFLFSEAGDYIEGKHTNISKGAYVTSPPRRTIEDFLTYLRQAYTFSSSIIEEMKWNKWLVEVFRTNFDCDPLNCSTNTEARFNATFRSSVYTTYAVQTALVAAKLVRNRINAICNSINLCTAFFNTSVNPRNLFIQDMNKFTVDFDNDFTGIKAAVFRIKEFQNPIWKLSFNGSTNVNFDASLPLYEVYNHQNCDGTFMRVCFKKVSEFKGDELIVFTSEIKDYDVNDKELSYPNIRKPQCPDGAYCDVCFINNNVDPILVIQGELYIVGIVPVHNKGKTPLECGDIKHGGLDLVEMIQFAVFYGSNLGNKPTGTIGIIIIDSCNDEQIVRERVLNLHRNGVMLHGSYVPVSDRILGYVGGWSSSVSIAVAELTTRLGFAQISYASTAPQLSQRTLYPYFLRTPSSDSSQARAMLQLVKELEANFIQIVYSANAYGEGGRDLIINLAKNMDICVGQTTNVTLFSKPGDIVASIRNVPEARIVVMFTGSSETEILVPFFNALLTKNEFLFIGSDGWGTRINLKQKNNLIGTITLAAELGINTQFGAYLKTLNSSKSNSDYWIRPYLENYFGCYYQWNYNKTSGTKCSGNERLDELTTNYTIEVWTQFAERAVVSLLQGARQALDKYCNNSARICDNFRKNTQGFVDILKNQTWKVSGQTTRIFDNNGDGFAGYRIYMVALDTGGDYRPIGEFQPAESTLVISSQETFKSIQNSVAAKCSDNSKCQQCFPESLTSKEKIPTWSVIVIVILAVLACTLSAILIPTCYRRGNCVKIENGRLKYITPIYLQGGETCNINSGKTAKKKKNENEIYDQIHSIQNQNLSSNVILSQTDAQCVDSDVDSGNIKRIYSQ